MFKEFLKAILTVGLLVAIGCFFLFFTINQPPQRVLYEAAQSRMCVKVVIGDKEFPCSNFTSEELRNSDTIFVDEDYAHYEIIKMALNQ